MPPLTQVNLLAPTPPPRAPDGREAARRRPGEWGAGGRQREREGGLELAVAGVQVCRSEVKPLHRALPAGDLLPLPHIDRIKKHHLFSVVRCLCDVEKRQRLRVGQLLRQNSRGRCSRRWSWSRRLRAQRPLPTLLWLRIIAPARIRILTQARARPLDRLHEVLRLQSSPLAIRGPRLCVAH